LRGVVGVTGSPGTGKKSVSPLLAATLRLKCLSINDLARECGALAPGEGSVDVDLLRSKISKMVPGPALIHGHLLPYVLEPGSVRKVVVLRCAPGVLKTRLRARGYPARKVEENVEAELIGVVSADAYGAFGSAKTFEFDTTQSSPVEAAERIARSMRKGRPTPRIDWTLRYDSGAKLRSLFSAR
jgi:adenylate kinase